MKTPAILLCILLGLPILLWPVVMIANIMSLAAIDQLTSLQTEEIPNAILMLYLLGTTTLYPLLWLGATIACFTQLHGRRNPLIWFAIPGGVILTWIPVFLLLE